MKIKECKYISIDLQVCSFLVHLGSVIEDYQVKLEYHHHFHMYNIIRIVFQGFVLHHSKV